MNTEQAFFKHLPCAKLWITYTKAKQNNRKDTALPLWAALGTCMPEPSATATPGDR